MAPDRPTFSARIKQLREEAGMTQQMLGDSMREFAEKNGYTVKVSQQAVSNWERIHDIDVSHELLLLVADYWGVTLDFLLGRVEGKSERWKPAKKIRGGGELRGLGSKGGPASQKAPHRSG